jgi:putative sterol carrier protein
MDFNTIKEELAVNIKKIDAIGKKLKFELDDDVLVIDGTGEENILSEENVPADCTVIMSKETYLKLQQKKIKPLIATLKGQLKVKGDLGLARKLKQLM